MNRASRALAVRSGEGRLVGLLALAFALAEAGRGLGEVGADTLVLTRSGAGILPALYVGLGIVGLVATNTYGAALTRVRGERFFPVLLAFVAVVLLAERLLALPGMLDIYPVLWVSVYAVGLLLTTVLWTIAGRVFDPRQAKRLFPLCTSAAIGGGFVGLVAAGPLARLLGAGTLVVVQAVAILAAGVTLAGLGVRLAAPRRVVTPSASPAVRSSLRRDLTAGARYALRSPLMRLIAIAYLLFAVLLFSLSFPFLRAMSAAYPDEGDLATALGLIAAAVTAASFVASTVLANRLFAAIGVATVAMLLPLVYVMGFSIWIVAFGLTTAVGFRFCQQVVQRGLSNAAWTAFFGVVPGAHRGQVLSFMDGMPGQLGTIVSGVLLSVAASLGAGATLVPVFVLGLLTAVLCLVVTIAIRRVYGASLVATLREGLAEQVLEGGPGLAALGRDPGVVTELRAALRTDRAGERRLAAELLGELRVQPAVTDLVPLVTDEDRLVRLATVDALGKLGGPTTVTPITAATSDPDPEVRAAAVRAAGLVDGSTAGWLQDDVIERLSTDPDPRVRGELAVAFCRRGRVDDGRALMAALIESSAPLEQVAGLEAVARMAGNGPLVPFDRALVSPDAHVRAAAVAAVGALEPTEQATANVVAALADPAPAVRSAASRSLAARSDVPAGVVEMLKAGPDPAQDAAVAAIGGDAAAIRDELIDWAVGQVSRAIALRRHAITLEAAASVTDRDGAVGPAGDAVTKASTAFLAALLRRRGVAIEARLLRVLAILGAREASGLIRRCLRSADPETRAQAIEAVDALGERRLARAVVSLLDAENEPVPTTATSPADVARSLIDDPDGWVRAFAFRTLGASLAAERRIVLDRARRDRDPAVRAALDGILPDEGADVPDSRPILHDIDRMLFLRGVPLFSMLAPEDLQRLAATAVERRYAGGEAIVREGDLGDELVVIVEGEVRIVRSDDGVERVLRRYGAGNHIGELAVLREGRRAATVYAEEPGVRGLVIGGDGLKAILLERPEAAMAMLATLADRISAQ